MAGGFDGRTAVITGASRGIGLEIARRLVREGARVVLTARGQDALDDAVEQLGGPAQAVAVAGKADDAEHRAAVVRTAMDTFGSVDFLVNNAGINPAFGPLVDVDLGVARKILEVNCLAALSLTQLVHRAWMAEHGGAVVNVSSTSGIRPAPGVGLYGASKAMLSYLTQQLALELAPGVRVNAVAPAVVKTAFATPIYGGREDEVAAAYPMQRLGTTSDVSALVAFLLSDEAAWLTGQEVVLDGGRLLHAG